MTLSHALTRVFAVIVISIFFAGTALAGGRLFDVYNLKVDGKKIDYVIDDMNADGLKDCLFFFITETPDAVLRNFSIFYQTPTGFNTEPDQQFEVDPEAIVFDVADVDKAKGKEILFFTHAGLFYYRQDLGKYKKSSANLLKADSIFKVVDPHSLPYFDFARDLNNDGTDEILIPRFGDYYLYRQDRGGNYIYNTSLDIKVRTSIAASKEVSRYLAPSFITPNIVIADYNRDQRNDIIVVQNTYLKVFFQNKTGGFHNSDSVRINLGVELTPAYSLMLQENPHRGDAFQKEKIGMKYLQDINNDGLQDIIIERFSLMEGAFNQKKQYDIFFGKPSSDTVSNGTVPVGGRFNDTPDHIISNDNYQMECVIMDLNQDNKQDIVVPFIEMGFLKIISMLISGKINVTAQVFMLDDNNTFPDKPDDTYDFSMKVDRTGKIIPVVSYAGDYNGDGRRDLITNDEDNLLIHYGPEKGFVKNKPSVVYPVEIPDNGNKVQPIKLNADNKSDIIIVYPDDQSGDMVRVSDVKILMSI